MAQLFLDDDEKIVWQDYKRIFKIPWKFTKYTLTNKRIFVEQGILKYRCDEIKLFRICDISITRTVIERICSTGTVVVKSSDKSAPNMKIGSVFDSAKIRQAVTSLVDQDRVRRGVSAGEFIL
jgi:uncharacterized membrane protein YdbT with pleckstrin-like domain